jgi:uncharacterized protein YndB with AHSA1/START domain
MEPRLNKKELRLIRIIEATGELVFKAWTDTNHLQQWCEPKGFTNSVCQVDVRKGKYILK